MAGIVFNPNLVLCTWGSLDMSSHSADDIVDISFDENAVTRVPGANGEFVWVVNQNRGGKIKMSFLQGSPICEQLSAKCIQVGDRKAKLYRAPYVLTDMNGSGLAVTDEAVLEKIPNITRKKTHQPVEFTWDVGEWKKLSNGGVSTPDGPGGSLISAIRGLVPGF